MLRWKASLKPAAAASGLTPTVVNSIGATSNGKQSRTIDISSATNGAVMFLCWTHRSISSTNAPSGWTFLCDQDNGSHNWRPDTNIFYKTAGASESSVTLSCSNYEYMTAGVIEIVGADTSTLSYATRLGNIIPSVTQSAGGLVFAVHGTAAGNSNTAATTWTNSSYTSLFDQWGWRSGTAVAWADFGAGATNGTDTATGWGGADGAGNCCLQVAVDAV